MGEAAWRRGGGGGVEPFLNISESHSVAYIARIMMHIYLRCPHYDVYLFAVPALWCISICGARIMMHVYLQCPYYDAYLFAVPSL